MMPTFKYILSFKLDFYDEFSSYEEYITPKKRSDFNSFDDVRYETLRSIYNSMGLKLYSVAWTEIELTPKNIQMLLEAFKELKEKRVVYPSAGHIYETLSEESVTESEWFSIRTDTVNNYEKDLTIDDGYPFSKAYQYPPYVHIQGHFVSEDFKALVEKEKLTGVDFLWAEDKGKYVAKQWYAMRATQAIGRGFDTPWFDNAIYKEFQTVSSPKAFVEKMVKDGYTIDGEKYLHTKRAEYEQTFSKKNRIGITYFPAVAVGDRLSSNPLLNNLIHQFSLIGGLVNGLVISTVPRFLEQYLPQSDFAYYWKGADNEGHQAERVLCFRKKVKELLLSNAMIKEETISPLAIYDRLPEGCMDLANNTEYPPSIYTDEVFNALKNEEQIRREKFNKKNLPRRVPNIKNTLKLLRHTKKEQADSSLKGMSKKKIEEFIESMEIILPTYWLEVLKISNGGEYGSKEGYDCILIPLAKIELFHLDEVKYRKQIDENYEEEYTYFASTVTGDSYAFIKAPSLEVQDTKVVLISHEDFSIIREWESIADFLESILLG
jgi:hypothetical protein